MEFKPVSFGVRQETWPGGWRIGGNRHDATGLQIARRKRPNWLHRTFNALLLGIVWVDEPITVSVPVEES